MVVEIKDRSAIEVCSDGLNEWIDCVFFVADADKDKAIEVLKEAWDSFWEYGQNACYGDWLTDAMKNAGIPFEIFYRDEEEN